MKSEELCKLLGIEPEIEDNYCLSHYNDCPAGTQCCCPENCSRCRNYAKHYEYYPNFEKPENFVKLLEIAYKLNCVNNVMPHQKTNYVHDFISEMTHYIDKNPYNDVVLEIIKLAKETEWRY